METALPLTRRVTARSALLDTRIQTIGVLLESILPSATFFGNLGMRMDILSISIKRKIIVKHERKPNQSLQPTPGECQAAARASLARRGCALRSATRLQP